MINKNRLIRTFKELVRIDSPPLKERAAFNYVKKQLRSMGITSRETGRPRGGEVGSLIAYLAGKGNNRHCIMLNAHIDTVAPGHNIRPITRGGYIQTNGSTILGADNKAGVAAILEVLRSIKQEKLDHPPLLLIFTVAEEIGLVGAKVLPDQVMKADFGLTLDGGDIDTIINQAPSQYNLTARIIGKAAHAGIHPEQGVNAIKVASEAIAKMRLGRIDSETTANIGVIAGGTATNIIPEEVELKGEARSHNMKKLDRQVAHMEKTLLAACHKYKARVKLKVERVYRSFSINRKSRLMELVISGMKKNGLKPVIKKTGGGSDANIFNEWGIPTLILGVGADHVHTNRERIRIDDLVAGTETVMNILKEAVQWTNSKKKR
jgi:tripeptide aminopeptidase